MSSPELMLAARNDSGGLWLLALGAAACGVFWLISTIQKSLDEAVERRAQAKMEDREQQVKHEREARFAELERRKLQEHDEHIKNEINSIKEERRMLRVEQQGAATKHERRQEFLEGLRTALEEGYVETRKWLAQMIAEAEKPLDDSLSNHLVKKKHPAASAAITVQAVTKEKREALARVKHLEYQYAMLKEYFPAIDEYEDLILSEVIDLAASEDGFSELENSDRTRLYLSPDEYKNLPTFKKNQLALDRYLSRRKNNWEIGRLYERYIGYLYEYEGWDVEYIGATTGLEDMGRDLVCKRNGIIEVVQVKCWARHKVIREKHIFQLFGTTLAYQLETARLDLITPVFVTTTGLSEVAAVAAERLGVEVRKIELNTRYPMIKCNISQQSLLIYHLPFDQQYDRVKINKPGECYVTTVDEAESQGFRRAHRYIPTAV